MNKPIRVLYVDDNPHDRELVRDALEKESGNFKVVEAATEKEFKKALEKGGYDLVLSDFHIVGFKGLEVFQAVKAKAPDIPVVIVTGTGSEEIAVSAMKLGVADYVIKTPAHILKLPQTILAVLEKERLKKEHKQAEKEIRRVGQEWMLTFDSITDWVSILDKDFKIVRANRAYVDSFNMKPEKLIGKPCYEVVHGTKEPWPNCPHRQTLETKKPAIKEFFEPHLGIYLEITTSPIFNENGEATGAVHIAKDITERKQTEKELAKRTYDLGERIKELDCLYGISKLAEKQDISLEEIAQGVVNLIPPGWQYPEITCAQVIMKGQEFRTENFRETIWKQASDIIVHGDRIGILEVSYLEEKPEIYEGPFLKEERALIAAIAERLGKIIEQKRAEKSLQESENQIRLLLNSTAEGIYGLDMDGKCTFANRACIQSLGYKASGELIGKNMHDLIHHSYPDATPYPIQACPIFQAFQKGEYIHVDDEVLWKADGTSFPAEYWSYPIEKDGQILGAVVTFLDIIERRKAEKEKAKLETQLQQAQKMEAIGTLAGGIAHDFNNILTTIIGNAHITLMDFGKDNPLREGIEEIKKAGERAATLTRQLLAFSRKQVIETEILNINETLTDMDKMLGRLIGEDVELKVIPEPALWQVEIDPGQVEQIIMNLVVNARDAMPKGGKLTVETANVDLDENYFREHGVEAEPGSYVMLATSDTGIGMDEETRSRIFEPFFTTKEIGSGTGLGLSTVYGIVKQAGGVIWVYSEPGKGSTFKVYLPRTEEDADSGKKEQISMDRLSGSETVLIVEDDEKLRNLGRKILKRFGYSVLEAENGEDALRVSEAHDGSIDLLITDVVMPKMSGKETAERLQPLYPQMKVIYMSGYTDNAIVHHGVLAPGLNFLEKPFTPEGLARKVREVLD